MPEAETISLAILDRVVVAQPVQGTGKAPPRDRGQAVGQTVPRVLEQGCSLEQVIRPLCHAFKCALHEGAGFGHHGCARQDELRNGTQVQMLPQEDSQLDGPLWMGMQHAVEQ